MFKILDIFLKDVPLEGWRTIVIGYASTTLPAVLKIIEGGTTGVEFWFNLAGVLAGPLIHYYKKQGDENAKKEATTQG